MNIINDQAPLTAYSLIDETGLYSIPQCPSAHLASHVNPNALASQPTVGPPVAVYVASCPPSSCSVVGRHTQLGARASSFGGKRRDLLDKAHVTLRHARRGTTARFPRETGTSRSPIAQPRAQENGCKPTFVSVPHMVVSFRVE